MQRTLKGQRYDTETATKVCKIEIGTHKDSNFLYCALYQRVRSKDFFIAGIGGYITRFAKLNVLGGYDSGPKLLPITGEQARQLAEQFADSTVVERFFGGKE